jgi:hypothetical protein
MLYEREGVILQDLAQAVVFSFNFKMLSMHPLRAAGRGGRHVFGTLAECEKETGRS